MKLSFKRKLFGWIESFDNWTFLNERDFVLHRARKAFSLSYVTANDGMVTNLTWQSDLKKKKKNSDLTKVDTYEIKVSTYRDEQAEKDTTSLKIFVQK